MRLVIKMIKVSSKGDFRNTIKFLENVEKSNYINILKKYGEKGVNRLKAATPVDSGKTANSWKYKIEHNKNKISLVWYNTNINDGVPIALILQTGHGTRTGGYVRGIDYINPAMKPVFDEIANDVWKEVIGK